MSAEALAEFGRLVVVDRALQAQLLDARDRDRFVALVVKLSRDAGWDVTAGDVEDGLRASLRGWRARWI